MNQHDFEAFYLPISYQASNWFFDLLPLNRSSAVDPEFLKIDMRDIQRAMGCASAVDFVFAVDEDVLVAVCLKERKAATCRYREGCKICGLYTSSNGAAWLDVVCSVEARSWGRREASISLTCFLFVLTKENTVIKISVQPSSYSLVEEYRVFLNRQVNYKKILLNTKPQIQINEKNRVPNDTVYLWAPVNKVLQSYNLYRDGTGELQREVRIKRPKWTVQEGSPEIAYDPQALTLYVDEMEDSVICADRTNHLLFECSLKTSYSEVLCGQGKPGCPEENMKTPAAFLNMPCAPLVLRPGEYISLDKFDTFAKTVVTAEKVKQKPYGKRPRLILVCDAGNDAVRKIWQFPSSQQAQDLAKLNRIYTLLSKSEIEGCTGDLLGSLCGKPKGLFIGPSGRLTVTTDSSVYILAAHIVIYEDRTYNSIPSDS